MYVRKMRANSRSLRWPGQSGREDIQLKLIKLQFVGTRNITNKLEVSLKSWILQLEDLKGMGRMGRGRVESLVTLSKCRFVSTTSSSEPLASVLEEQPGGNHIIYSEFI